MQCYSDYVNSEGSPYWGVGWNLNLNTFELYPSIQGADRHLTITPVGDGWYRIEFVTAENDIVRGPSHYWIDSAPAEILLAYPQKEAKPFATSFVDGTRTAGRLSYPKSLVAGLNALTVAAWTSGPPYWASGNKYLVAAQTSGTGPYGDLFALRQPWSSNQISLWVRNDANSSAAEPSYSNVWDGNWHHIVGVINKFPQPGRQPIELYVDGELVASNSNVNAVPDLSNIDETWGVQVGNWRAWGQWNGLIDELLILPYAATEEEIKGWYEAKGAFVDQAEINYQQSQIVQLADEISSKVSRYDFDALEDTVTAMGTVVTQTAEAVEQKAELSTVTELADNLSQVTSDVGTLTTSYNSITARVESIEGDIDTLTGDVSEI
ncbi:MAG TPA: LamG domain-containing protein, partial [Bacillota bacterium]|nr:LamG domain-containing protein [Bacillota bacterium]